MPLLVNSYICNISQAQCGFLCLQVALAHLHSCLIFHGSLPASSQDIFFLSSYQLNRFPGEGRRSTLGTPSIITFKMIRHKHKSGWKELCVRLLQNGKNKLQRGIAHSVISYQTLYVTFTLGESLRVMLRARCLRLITHSITGHCSQIKEIAVSLITWYAFVHTIYRDLGNLGEDIMFAVTVFFITKKYPKLIEITLFPKAATHSCLNYSQQQQYHTTTSL